MKTVSLFLDNPQLELRVQVADNFLQRLRGLMLRSPASLPLGTGLLIAPCNSIHMMFMRFAIDVVYLAEDYTVVKTVKNVRPWLGISACFKKGTWAVLELPIGSIEHYGVAVGKRFLQNDK
ncbi:MAG: DUF192 domain-containing protein [Selenomonadaceae bacterium]|nr:DUF192 domain-containing protein [Selenomonadaceae bacterium]MBQ5845904.1 DUF192 domain-containing protein [Selenomonadaceae bacterium]MBQ5921192.1 DUF192 domain-containing protein [Selenomonadaceae bacterium]